MYGPVILNIKLQAYPAIQFKLEHKDFVLKPVLNEFQCVIKKLQSATKNLTKELSKTIEEVTNVIGLIRAEADITYIRTRIDADIKSQIYCNEAAWDRLKDEQSKINRIARKENQLMKRCGDDSEAIINKLLTKYGQIIEKEFCILMNMQLDFGRFIP